MADDQLDVKQEAGEVSSISTSSVEEPKATEEVSQETEQVESTETADQGAEQTETDESSKKGASARIRELNAKAKSAEQKAISLEKRLSELTNQSEQSGTDTYVPQVEPGQEYSPEQYKQDVLKTADALVSLKIKQSNAVNKINSEARAVLQAYPQLDPDHELFDPELSEAITEATEAHVRANPYSASPKKLVDKLMKPYQRAVTREVGKVTENIAKQVSETATRPTSISTKGGKSDKDKSIQELERELGLVTS